MPSFYFTTKLSWSDVTLAFSVTSSPQEPFPAVGHNHWLLLTSAHLLFAFPRYLNLIPYTPSNSSHVMPAGQMHLHWAHSASCVHISQNPMSRVCSVVFFKLFLLNALFIFLQMVLLSNKFVQTIIFPSKYYFVPHAF